MSNGEQPPANITTISISVSEEGHFTYSHSTLLMVRREKEAAPTSKWVKWTADGPFVLDFGDRSPFEQLIVRSEGSSSASCALMVGADVGRGRYRYAVAVWKQGQGKVFLDHCPEVAIDC